MRKAQVEIIGFMVIVLLLFFALVLYFQFAGKEPSGLLQETEQGLEVSDLLDAIRLYTACEGTSLGDAIQSCAQGGGFSCDEDSCTLVRGEVAGIVAANGWKEDSYMFFIDEELYSPGTCQGDSLADSYTTAGIDVRLVYCY